MASASKIATDYVESFNFLQAKKRRQAQQLVLLNNIRRGDEYIASTLLLTIFNRVMASLYDDKIQVKFLPSQGINQDQINAYNILAQSDYQEMNKAKLDYDWCWDALFFGRGYMETLRFDKKRKIMQPHVINPLVMGYDPYFDNPQEWRYYWKWITKNKHEINAMIKAGIITGIKDADELPSGIDSYLWQYKIKIDQARDGIAPSPEPLNKEIFQILEYFGYDDDGNKTIYWTDKNRSKVIFEQKLDLGDGDELIGPDGTVVETGSNWPIVVKEAFRQPHSSIPFSVADILEDKHRAKSVLLNLAYIAAKDQANPLYWYDVDKVKDVSQLLSRQINQHIPVEGNGNNVIGPLNKAGAMNPELMNFISILQQEATEPVGSSQQSQPTGRRNSHTATQAAIEQQLNDLAQSLQSKVMQFGESEFWNKWFHCYAKYGEELKEKIANIVGVKGITTHTIDLSLFKTDFPPGVLVYSAKQADYEELVLRRDFMDMYPALSQTLDPDGMRNFQKFVFFPKFLQDPSLIDIMFPKTIDELKAEQENEQLAKEQFPPVGDADDHQTHIYVHSMLSPKTNALWFHVAEHESKLSDQKKQAQQQQMVNQSMNQMSQGNPQVSQPQVSNEKRNPQAQASPLKTEMTSNLQANKTK